MTPTVHNENKIVISLVSIIFLVSVLIVAIQRFTELDFGFLGRLDWIIVISGALYFIYRTLAPVFGWE